MSESQSAGVNPEHASPADVVSEPPPERLADLLARMDHDPAPVEEHKLERPLNALRRALNERGEAIVAELEAEVIAFGIWRAHDESSAWAGYFGPPWQEGMLGLITAAMVDYWRERARATPHPVLRARYADLSWEIPKGKRISGARPDADMARVAVDAYLEAIQRHRYSETSDAADASKRALELALSLRDAELIQRARDGLIALDQEIATDEHPGLWLAFDVLVEPPNKSVPLSKEQRDGLVRDMEDRLARFLAGPANEYHPTGAEAAALRLAAHYRRLGQKDDVARVLRAYEDVVRRMHGTAAPLVVVHSLTNLYAHLKTFELHEEADALNDLQRVVGEEAMKDMKEISVSHEVPRETIEAHFDALLAGSASDALNRIAVHYIPHRGEVENQLRELAQNAPISFLVSHAIVDDQGRTVAEVGPLEHDLEGNVLKQMGQNLGLSVPWLREAMARGFDRGLFSVSVLLEHLMGSPLFSESRRKVLENGLDAYARGDSIAAIHVLVPQIEEGIRQLAILLKAPLYAQRRGGGFHARLLDEFLRDSTIGATLTEHVTTYFRALLTDPRGWNIRNDIAHGRAPESMMQMPIADRVVHALLVLALIRLREEVPESGPETST